MKDEKESLETFVFPTVLLYLNLIATARCRFRHHNLACGQSVPLISSSYLTPLILHPSSLILSTCPLPLFQLYRLGLLEHMDSIDKSSRHRLVGNNQALGSGSSVEKAHSFH